MLVLCTRKIPDTAARILEENGFEVHVLAEGKAPTHEEIVRELSARPYTALVSLLTDSIDDAVMDAAPALKVIANYATGYNNIDLAAARKRNITVLNTPGVSALAVAEHTVALMFALTTRLVEGDAFVRSGNYTGWDPLAFMGTDLSRKTVGFVGVGNIGSLAAKMLCRGFDARIIYYDLKENRELEEQCGAERKKTLEELLAESDIVTLHVPLLPSTHHLLGAAQFEKMKRSALVINTSRGPVIDENALVAALREKRIAGAGLDVFEFEPKLAPGLAELPTVVLTPHIASARETTRTEMARLVAEGIVKVFSGEKPDNVVGWEE